MRDFHRLRKIAGQYYGFHKYHGSKAAARDEARLLRRRGYKVRVLPDIAGGWGIWRHGRPKA